MTNMNVQPISVVFCCSNISY